MVLFCDTLYQMGDGEKVGLLTPNLLYNEIQRMHFNFGSKISLVVCLILVTLCNWKCALF